MHDHALNSADSGKPSKCQGHFDRHRAAVARRKPLIAGPNPLTYGELFDRVPKIGALLDAWSVSTGDRVILLSDDDRAVATLFFGLVAHGVTAVLLNPEAPLEELETLIEASDASAIFADRQLVEEKGLAAIAGSDVRVVGIAGEASESGMRGLFRRRTAADADAYPALLDGVDAADRQLPGQALEQDHADRIVIDRGVVRRA